MAASFQFHEIDRYLRKTLDKKRYTHTLGVANTAACLAMRYSSDVNKAYLAGLLHDNAKCISTKKKMAICQKAGLSISKIEEKNPELLHSKVGSYLAKQKFHIEDSDILNAICYHTTGRPNMSLLEKIIFVADYMEPNRKIIPGLDQIRSMAFQNLDNALLLILENTLSYIKKKDRETDIDPMTQKTYDYYKKGSK
ncbi:MAG: HD domain-containing protein [Lachnospiraceae bacterium]|nr:HD domain-containing protein [Lachnospiraceae bacterium]